MNTFYFNTGVTPTNNPHLSPGQVWRGGVKQIPFDADAPAKSRVLFLSNYPDQPERNIPGVIVREVSNTVILSKYAYLQVPQATP